MSGPRVGAAAAVLGLLALAGCTGEPEPPTGPVVPAWQEVTLPASDPPGRTIREVTSCGSRWYAVGALRTADSPPANQPAAWTSTDGRQWRPVALRPAGMYGRRSVLQSVACRDDRVVAVGAASGGVHGNPRTSTWSGPPDGPWAETEPEFETFGGSRAVNVGRLAGGAGGFLISGNWLGPTDLPGVAAWRSTDGVEWTRVDADPALASVLDAQTRAHHAAAAPQGGWVLVGEVTRPGPAGSDGAPGRAQADPAAWTSPDGRAWRAAAVPAQAGNDALRRVAGHPGGLVAVGARDAVFGAWRASADGSWSAGGTFGDLSQGGGVWEVTGLVTVPRAGGVTVLATVCDGLRCTAWLSADGGGAWRPVTLPVDLNAGTDRGWRIAASGDRLLLVRDNGREPQLWSAPVP